MTRNGLLFLLILTFSSVFAANTNPDIKIISQSAQQIVFEWKPQQVELTDLKVDGKSYKQLTCQFSQSLNKPGQPDIPVRTITVGLPDERPATVTIAEVTTHTVENVHLSPVPYVAVDRFKISNYFYQPNDSIYRSSQPFPAQILSTDPPARFRDLPIQGIHLAAAQYIPAENRLIVYDRIRFVVRFASPAQTAQSASLLQDRLLNEVGQVAIANFAQARKWVKKQPVLLKKSSALPEGTFYRITVKKDGLYKITPSVLETAGIDVSNLLIDKIAVFNNGGHQLSYNAKSLYYNPQNTLQIPVMVFDQNNNGKFDGSDYLLFYGKSVNGWFYEPASKRFAYQMHHFATENYYYLSVNASASMRMGDGNLPPAGSGAAGPDFFYDRYHFEEDLYNLLASGPDWYGYRFFGTSGSYTKKIDLPLKTDASEASVEFRIQFKGGSGILWTDYKNYRYDFNVRINNKTLFSQIGFNNKSLIQFKTTRSDYASLFQNGSNTLSITYTGNRDACNVYLDWFEIVYPRSFEAVNDQLLIFLDEQNKDVNYTVRGLSNKSDFVLIDVTDPAHPYTLAKNLQSQNGQLPFTLPASTSKRQIYLCSLSSSEIKFVTELKPFTPQQNLLNPANQADYIVITHKTFLPYAQKIAERHAQSLSTKVISMDDIYFYFSSGVPDPTAIRNFLRYAYQNWTAPTPTYVLFFGDAHYDYRNINLPDTIRVPTWEIYDAGEIDSRCTDDYLVDIDYASGRSFSKFTPDFATGRIPVESVLDCKRVIQKLDDYFNNSHQDGWQTNLTLVADDQSRPPQVNNEYMHQNQSENIAKLSELRKFIINRVYLSTYPSAPGGFVRVKPKANNDLIDYLNQGTLIVNYIGHGNPTKWAHEDVFEMDRDYPRIQNEGRLCFLVAATCDFGKFDDPNEPSFTEALIWKEKSGIIGALASTRLAYSNANYGLASNFFQRLFPNGNPSAALGLAKMQAVYLNSSGSSINDQKYILFADPAMHLIDAREKIEITSIQPDTLKALSTVTVKAKVSTGQAFNGEAVLIVHDAAYKNVITANGFNPITIIGPRIFKGQVDVQNGELTGSFIIPKSIRYVNEPTGRLTIYAYSPETGTSAMGYNSNLLINGSQSNIYDQEGPQIDVYFKDQENFTPGDLIPENTVLIVRLEDDNGINITGEAGHNISLQIDDEVPRDISGYFAYEKNSYQKGVIEYPLTQLKNGPHTFKVQAFDNLNNLNVKQVEVKVAASENLLLDEVVNYPNPFRTNTRFTFQTNVDGADVTIKIYTVTGRLIQELYGTTVVGYNDAITWDGTDRDGDEIANGVYLYKIIIRDGNRKIEHIDKLVILR